MVVCMVGTRREANVKAGAELGPALLASPGAPHQLFVGAELVSALFASPERLGIFVGAELAPPSSSSPRLADRFAF